MEQIHHDENVEFLNIMFGDTYTRCDKKNGERLNKKKILQ